MAFSNNSNPLRLSFKDVVGNVSSAIVSIETRVTVETNPAEIFGPFMFQEPKKIERKALGSGVLLTKHGFIVTNDHVIDKADKIKITTADQMQYDCDVILRDGLHDLAIIRILLDDGTDDDYYDDYDDYDDDDDDDQNDEKDNKDQNNKKNKNKSSKKQVYKDEYDDNDDDIDADDGRVTFPYIKMGRAETLSVGDLVLAIGNNLGFHGTVTDGIISAIGRTNDERLPIAYPQFPLIQTNAAINGGSSGGALVNMKGELIGVNESIATSTGGNVGVGFAVPSNFVKPLLRAALKRSLDIERVWDGLTTISCPFQSDSMKKQSLSAAKKIVTNNNSNNYIKFGRIYPRGILIKSIHKKSPGYKAGLKRGDVILKIGDVIIDDINTYYLLIAGMDPTKKVKYHIIREIGSNSLRLKKSKQKQRQQILNQQRRRQQQKRQTFQRSMNNRKRFGSGNNSNNDSNDDELKSKHNTLVLKNMNDGISWVDFEKFEELDIYVTISCIPPPTSKPLEIKDRMNPFYGSEVVELCPAINSDFGLDFSQTGVAVWDIETGSQAYKLGFRIGDIIISFDNVRVKKLDDIQKMGDKMQLRKNCRIKFKRNGQINHVDVYLRTRRRYYSRL